jgi:glyoxylase-like metal-dependent hydrolase (beta-lactamase superfamily II)
VPPYTTTNTVIYGRKNFIVIDPGTTDKHDQEILINRINERLAHGDIFIGAYLTHHHGDHIGAATLLRDRYSIPIYAHEKSHNSLAFEIDKFLINNQEIILDSNIIIKILHTPGHAETHIVFYDPINYILIAGDMITSKGTILIPPESGCLKIYLQSLKFLSTLKLEAIIPAHGEAITNNAANFLREALIHRYKRIIAILETLERAPKALDATEITQAVYHSNIDDSLLFFAQLSVESTLSFLRDLSLADKINYRWVAKTNVSAREELIAHSLAIFN